MKKRIVFVLNNLQYADGVAKVLVQYIGVIQTL